MTKVYGVKGLMEWQALIRVGNASFHILFSDGSMSEYGICPALHTTDNPVVQGVIESSEYFKSGKIYLVRTYGEDKPKAEKKMVRKEFVTVDDARAFLVDLGVPSSHLRNRAQVVENGLKKGFEIVIE